LETQVRFPRSRTEAVELQKELNELCRDDDIAELMKVGVDTVEAAKDLLFDAGGDVNLAGEKFTSKKTTGSQSGTNNNVKPRFNFAPQQGHVPAKIGGISTNRGFKFGNSSSSSSSNVKPANGGFKFGSTTSSGAKPCPKTGGLFASYFGAKPTPSTSMKQPTSALPTGFKFGATPSTSMKQPTSALPTGFKFGATPSTSMKQPTSALPSGFKFGATPSTSMKQPTSGFTFNKPSVGGSSSSGGGSSDVASSNQVKQQHPQQPALKKQRKV